MLRFFALLVVATLASSATINRDIDEDAVLSVPELLTKYGYPAEAHEVQTPDGYLLTIHRIPYGKGQDPGDRPVVFIMHGLLSSSADWVTMGPDNALGYLMADEGYDVWMGNARGNYYSRKHATLDPDRDSSFWKFSWHEIGYYDLPSMIDYVLYATGKSQLQYAGHSQGTTSFFVMASQRPEYNAKIKSMHALAPIAYMGNMASPLVRLVAPFGDTLELLSSLIGINEFLPSTSLTTIAGDLLCSDSAIFQPLCSNIIFLLCGFDSDLLNTTMLPVIMGHTPAGSSSMQMVHYLQEHNSGYFRQYDHGIVDNLVVYGSLSPPNYDLKKVTAPVALHYADNDWMAAVVDVTQLNSELGNSIGMFRVPFDKFNHLDFMWAIGVRDLLYNRVVSIMKQYE